MPKILTANTDRPNSHKIETYLETGGYRSLEKLATLKPDELIEMIKSSGLRGRGGAGFPTGVKWGFIPKAAPIKYLCCNADEGEPGTFKDRYLLEKNPHQLIEGIIIACTAIGVQTCYIYIRGEFELGYQRVAAALAEAKEKGFVGKNVDIVIHRGAGAYICGEETALLNSIEGERGEPRIKPPFPAIKGLFGAPTVVNNVETLSALPWILNNGAEAYKKIGPVKGPGTRLFSISGPVKKPGVYEVEMGTRLRTLIDQEAGGMLPGRTLKAVIPGGSSAPVLNAEEAEDALLDFEWMAAHGTMLGSGGVIVIDETQCMVKVLEVITRFYKHESCGQCTPCREGTGWLHKVVKRLEQGDGTPADFDLLKSISNNMCGNTICVLADAVALPVVSFVTKFRGEFEEHLAHRGCPIASVS